MSRVLAQRWRKLAMLLHVIALVAVACYGNAAWAGSACDNKKTEPATFIKAMQLAANTRQALEDSGAQVAMIARVGQDLSAYKLRYSHMAYVWRDHPKGRWLVVHELNQCGTAHSSLYDEGLGNFFLDDMFAYETRILIPSAASQQRIVAMLASRAPERLHTQNYNMLAYPFATTYQNSNQWVLETYAAGASDMPISERAQAQAWLKLAGYQPISLHLSAMTRLGARMFRANVAFDDQPFGRRMDGEIDTVTVDSVMRFVRQRDADTRDIVLSVD